MIYMILSERKPSGVTATWLHSLKLGNIVYTPVV